MYQCHQTVEAGRGPAMQKLPESFPFPVTSHPGTRGHVNLWIPTSRQHAGHMAQGENTRDDTGEERSRCRTFGLCPSRGPEYRKEGKLAAVSRPARRPGSEPRKPSSGSASLHSSPGSANLVGAGRSMPLAGPALRTEREALPKHQPARPRPPESRPAPGLPAGGSRQYSPVRRGRVSGTAAHVGTPLGLETQTQTLRQADVGRSEHLAGAVAR